MVPAARIPAAMNRVDMIFLVFTCVTCLLFLIGTPETGLVLLEDSLQFWKVCPYDHGAVIDEKCRDSFDVKLVCHF